ncbi:MAG: ADP-heptose--LPS heptosyltransferase 2 [Chlamydiales bacterium]|nr:ADP-heptose--LPS heptosyltransferase 2 [Chlamydiales bacterium]
MQSTYKNILIRMPNWLGDAVMATPIIEDVHKQWPDANLTAMTLGAVGSLLQNNPHLNEIFSFSKPNEFLRKKQKRDLIERIRQGKYDLGILLPNSFSSAWWFWRGQIKTRIGFASDYRTPLLSYAVPLPKTRGQEHLVTTYKRILTPLNIPPSETAPTLYVTPKEQMAAEQLLKQHHIPENATLIGINPGAAYGSAKCWLPERFQAVAKKLIERPNTYVIFFADNAGASLVHSICKNMPPQVINLAAATNLRELLALIQRCNAFLTNDSGPMHIAAALKTPLVALFGSTNDTATGPYGGGTVIHKHVDCSPCYRRTCPIDFRCMKQIEVEEVCTALLAHLETNSKNRLPLF